MKGHTTLGFLLGMTAGFMAMGRVSLALLAGTAVVLAGLGVWGGGVPRI